MIGILPFLIQWISLSQLGKQHPSYSDNNYHHSFPPKSHWTLLNEFQQLPEEEIEHFLPQVCNMVIDRNIQQVSYDVDLFEYFENILEKKCAECITFGARLSGILKASQNAPSEGLFKNVLTSTITSQQNQQKEERYLIDIKQ